MADYVLFREVLNVETNCVDNATLTFIMNDVVTIFVKSALLSFP